MSETKDTSALKLNRLKHASAAYQEHKRIHTEYELTGHIDPDTGKQEADEMAEGFMPWPEFREAFLKDWSNNRRIVDEKEADVHFDNIANEALSELEGGATVELVVVDGDGTSAETDTIGTIVLVDGTPTAVATSFPKVTPEVTEMIKTVIKKRGRPAGTGKAKVVKAAVVKGKRGRPAGKKAATKKAVVAKKKGTSMADQARTIISTWAGKGWERKDIISKLVAQLSMKPATASTYYQNYK